MSRFHLRLSRENHDTLDHRQQQLFQRQHYIRGDLSDLISACETPEVWQEFRGAWDQLIADSYMGDGGHYRHRRYSVFDYDTASGVFTINQDQRHFQALNYNSLNGGIYREYPAFEEKLLNSALFQALLANTVAMVQMADPEAQNWRIEAHQFRILASSEESGKPTPEGIHKDGRDYVAVIMVDRAAIKGGSSRIYNEKGKNLQQWKMRKPLEFMLINDRRLLHYVTSIKPLSATKTGHRDVLVLTFRKTA